MSDILAELQEKVEGIEDGLKANTELTKTLVKDTAEIIEFFNTAKAALTFLIVLGKILKWIAGTAAAAGLIWGAFKIGVTKPL